ncbi:tetratricopeptide repeat protein [Ascidiimonas aurantiaca]|uniref:tetratricopeptide repeat protein n=1 Tax=Ascidiimonas aurantiaca TaxID=1685432 RepID=UPI0030EB340C
MNKNYLLSITFCILNVFFLFSQDSMQTGFDHLEAGRYKEAEVFFRAYLEVHPENRTARLCYGRAVGLHNDPEQALTIFKELLEEYPDDTEIQLNFAEALLWAKRYTDAEVYYKELVTRLPGSFPATLGYANTLSNLKKYEEALKMVNKALMLSPKNPNAMLSRKYIRLGISGTLLTKKKYQSAIDTLKKNLTDLHDDRETLLSMANVYLIIKKTDSAIATYRQMAKDRNDSITALNGIALAHHISGKSKTALQVAESSRKKAGSIDNDVLKFDVEERYIQALIWNRKYTPAEMLIDSMASITPANNRVLALKATLHLYRSDFGKSTDAYRKILKSDSTSFDANLGIANTYKARDLIRKAYRAAYQTLTFYEGQKDAEEFIQKLDRQFTPFVEQKASYMFDNGENEAYNTQTRLSVPLSVTFSLLADYRYRKTKNDITAREAEANDFLSGFSWKMIPKLELLAQGGITSVTSFNTDYSQFLADVRLISKLVKLQDLELGYRREIQNFNADLLDREIVTNNYYINHNISSNFNLGWFLQYFYTTQTDDNERHLLFTSLYYNVLRKPALKFGANYQYISFKDRVPEAYFSPKRFHAVEIFTDLIKSEGETTAISWFYNVNAAAGYQFIEDEEKQATYRLQGYLGYQFSERFLMSVYGLHSNIASATAAGFTFTEVGIRLKWWFTKKPLFNTSFRP